VSFLDPFGIFDSGGSSSSASVTSTVNLNVNGLDNLNETITLAGGTKITEEINLKPVTVELKPVTVNENIDLKPVTLNENIDLKPVTLNENIDVQPVTLNENIDLKPVAVDTCQTFRLAPLPETEICQPYRHHVGYTMFGVEYMGVSYDGESKQLVDSPRRPQVVERIGHSQHHRRAPVTDYTGSRGIRVRVVDPDDE
jgi:hypothetical protein